MKKVTSILFLIIILYFFYQFGVNTFETSHNINYSIKSDDKNFEINEIYSKTKEIDEYFLTVKFDNYKFLYEVENQFNKRNNILESIKYIEKDGLMCIYPIFSKEEVKADIECSSYNQTYSYSYSLTINDLSQEFKNNLITEKFNSDSWNQSDLTPTTQDNLIIYQNNFLKGDYITLWEYLGIEIITAQKSNHVRILNKDIYENKYGIIAGKYYVLPDFKNDYQYRTLSIIDIVNNDVEEIELDDYVASDSYNNGVVDGKVYIFDNDNLKQIKIDPSKNEYEVVGSTDLNGQYFNGSWETRNIYDFKNSKLIFTKDYSKIEQFSNYSIKQILESSSNYYLLTTDDKFYKFNKNNLDSPLLLFQEKNISEIKLNNDTIYYIVGDTLYLYNTQTGKRELMKYSEFQYNNDNIFDVYNENQ